MSTAVVLNAKNGQVLYEDQAHAWRFPASMTKMMTAYMVFQALEAQEITMETLCPVSSHAASKTGSTLGLSEGDVISVDDALCGMLVKSANDAATVLGESVKESEDRAAQWMTNQAQTLGMTSTIFTNLSGLHDERMVSTASDMGRLAYRIITDFPEYYSLFGIKEFSYHGTKYQNSNSLLGIKGVDGMKTGNTDAAGFNLAISAIQKDKRIIAVVMNAKTSDERHETLIRLIDYGFKTFLD